MSILFPPFISWTIKQLKSLVINSFKNASITLNELLLRVSSGYHPQAPRSLVAHYKSTNSLTSGIEYLAEKSYRREGSGETELNLGRLKYLILVNSGKGSPSCEYNALSALG